jgi:hypothetical protein
MTSRRSSYYPEIEIFSVGKILLLKSDKRGTLISAAFFFSFHPLCSQAVLPLQSAAMSVHLTDFGLPLYAVIK